MPIIEVLVRYHALHGVPHPSGVAPQRRVRALVDTGATHVVLQPHIVSALALPFAAQMNNTVVGGGVHSVPAYAADIVFGSGPTYAVTDLLTLAQSLTGFDMVIGWDALRFTDWVFHRDGRFEQHW